MEEVPAWLGDIDNPDFENAGKVHDWRNHVGENMKRLWPTLTHEVRVAAALDADELAGREEWD